MKKLKLGILGLRRGSHFFPAILHEGGEVVAACEHSERLISKAKENYFKSGGTNDFPVFDDFDEFLKQDMDAVLLGNFFNEHAKYAIKCLEKNIHVLSETQSNVTMAEGVALVRAAEKSKAKYMLLENYPYMLFNLEMKKIVDGGSLGKILYAEGEYNHPGPAYNKNIVLDLYSHEKHWRRYLPATYYLTHSLAPLMYITGATPKRVTAMPVYHPKESSYSFNADAASTMVTLNDDGSVFRFFGCSRFGFEENSYRFCGEKGQVENVRGDENKIMLAYNHWEKPEDKNKVTFYDAEWSKEDKEIASKLGHDGGDYFIIRDFFDVIRGTKENVFNVYFATTMASVAILAHRSHIQKGMPYDIPDFRKEEDCAFWENDHTNPFYDSEGGTPNIPCCSNPAYKPSEKATKWFNETLQELRNENKK